MFHSKRANGGNSKKLIPLNPSHPIQDLRGSTTPKFISPDEMTSKDFYFDQNSHFRAHEKFLKDTVTMTAFQNVIHNNAHLFMGKVVLEVGCGTGILSMLIAKAGAKKVIAYEKSPISVHTKKIIAANKLSSVIKVVSGSIEKLRLPEGITKVDVIISDWMGFGVFYNSKLDSVLFARDKWLKPNGIIFPDRCTIYVTAIEHSHNKNIKIDWWEHVYGFNMNVFRKTALSEPVIAIVDAKHLVTDAFLIHIIDLYTAKIGQLDFTSKFQLTTTRDDYVHALVMYFNVEFTKSHTWIGFSTSPESSCTHWKQTIFYLDQTLTVKKGEQIFGKFSLQKNCNNNHALDIKIGIMFNGKLSRIHEKNHYKMI